MKRIMLLLVILLSTAKMQNSLAQTTNDEAGVRACLEDYMSGDGNRMEKAFHTSASMKYIDAQTGEFKDVPIADFIAREKPTQQNQKEKLKLYP